jgi:DNA-binding FadR family transcriptional regulator
LPLQKLEHEKRYLYVLDQLVNLIKEDGYQVGDRLPAERAIAESTGVSRSSVREAMAVLEVSGVIDVRVGDGIYVKSTSIRDLDVHSSITSPFDLIELRMCLESKVAGLAAQRRSEQMLEELQAILGNMDEIADKGDTEAYKGLDQRFHNTVAACTENEAIEQQTMTLVRHLYQPIWLALLKVYLSKEELGGMQDSLDEHRRIVIAIKNQNVAEAEDAMWDHLSRVQQRITGEV